jgi:predicted nucleic acid-binding protein
VVSHLVDSSVWVEFLRMTGSPSNLVLRRLISDPDVAIIGCPPVRMELALDPHDLRRHRFLQVYDSFSSAGVHADDFDLAAEVYRSVRRYGHTVRSTSDCLIAAIALRAGATLVHNDIDFDRIAQVVTPLTVLRLPDAPDRPRPAPTTA